MFDSTALLGAFRPFRLVSDDRAARSFWACRAVELLADWIFIVALFVMIYAITADIAIVAAFMLLRVAPRAVVSGGFHRQAARIGIRGLFLLSLPRVPLVASLALFDSRSDLVWAGAVVVAYGLLTALSNEARAAMLPHLVQRPQLVGVIQLNAAVERVTFVVGPLIAALILRAWDTEGGFVSSAIALGVTSVLLGIRAALSSDDARLMSADERLPEMDESPWSIARRQPTLRLAAGGLFTGAALAICLKVVLVELASDPLNSSEEMLGLLLALVGAGTLLGPLSVPRLLGHLSVPLIVTGSTMGIAAGIVLISVVTRIEIVALVLLGIGMISITNDMVTAAVTRRIAPEAELQGTGRLMLTAVIAGQIVAALTVALLARVWDSTDIMLAIGVVCAVAIGALGAATSGGPTLARRMARS